RELQLPGGVRIRTEFERAIIERCAPPPEEDTALSIPAVPPGTSFLATLQLAGMTYRVEARQVEPSATESNGSVIWRGRFPTSSLHFPLLLRGRRPGDRIRSRGLTKSLKK